MATAVLRGDVDAAFEFFAAAHGLISDKKVRVLVSTGPTRTRYLPDIPTAMESGLPNFDVVSWNGISVPTGTPQAVIDILVKGINEVLPLPDVQEKSQKVGMDMRGSQPAEMDKRLKDDIAKWSAVIEKAGIPKRD
jgi:tripartite-type tricarboxylate transporter receptor subunit TctC